MSGWVGGWVGRDGGREGGREGCREGGRRGGEERRGQTSFLKTLLEVFHSETLLDVSTWASSAVCQALPSEYA
jgi:hypothetical protein